MHEIVITDGTERTNSYYSYKFASIGSHSFLLSAPFTCNHARYRCYRLDRKPFINPRIIQDLTAWISDGGDQVVAINLPDAQLSNRYFCNVQIKNLKSGYPYVSWIDETKHYTNPVEFGYQYIGKSANGIYVVVTSDGGGGSEIDDDLLLLRFESGVGYDIDWETGVVTRQSRYLIEKISQVYLGNKWSRRSGEVCRASSRPIIEKLRIAGLYFSFRVGRASTDKMQAKSNTMPFELTSDYKPAGDQPEAIAQLIEGVERGDRAQVLLGVTGSGKTFTMSNVIAAVGRPTLVISHNKTSCRTALRRVQAVFSE